MAKTSNELATRALRFLGVVGAGQTASAEDLQIATDAIEPVFSQLAVRKIIYVPDLDAIDETYFLPLARILAAAIAPDFGIPTAQAMQEMGLPRMGETELRSLQMPDLTYQVHRADYY